MRRPRPAWQRPGPQAQVRRQRKPVVRRAGYRGSHSSRWLAGRLGECLPQRAAIRVVPGTGYQDTRRDRRTDVGRAGFRRIAIRERQNAPRLLRCISPVGTRQVRFAEAKAGPDQIKPTQLRFIELALRFHRSEQFMIIEVAGPSPRGTPGRMPRSAWEARRPVADQLRSNRQGLLRRAAKLIRSMIP